MVIQFSERWVTAWLIFIAVSLTLIHVVLQYLRWQVGLHEYTPLFSRFDVDAEVSIPTWYSQVLFLLASVLLWFVASLSRQLENARTWFWLTLSCAFLYMSIDDGAMLHEGLNEPVRSPLSFYASGWNLDNAWIYAVVPLLAIAGAFLIRPLLSLDRPTQLRFIIAAGVFLSGTVGLELLSTGYGGYAYKLVVALEELFEMMGVILFIRALLLYARSSEFSSMQVDIT